MSYKTENISLIRANANSYDFNSGKIDINASLPFANLFYPFLLDNGGNYRNISLTIDILKEFDRENKFPNENWVSKKRLRNNLTFDDIKWGFKETCNIGKDSRAISNGFCFADQKLSFYIATEGQDAGYLGDVWAYCKTTLTITVLDIITGTQTTLYTFSNFSVDKDDATRFFEWTVPAKNDTAFANYGLFGMFVIKLEVTRQYYSDAYRRYEITSNYPNKSQSLLQLLTFSAAREFLDVQSTDIPIITGIITEDTLLKDIFAQSVFSNFELLNDNALTDDQKRSIMADQAAVLFMSQHPVVTAEYYPSKIVGFGAEQGISPQYINSLLSSDIEHTLLTDRLYGMLVTYDAFNYVNDIENHFASYYLSQQKIRDPAKQIIVDENGILSEDFGVNGILFNPYVIENVNCDILIESSNTYTFDISLSPNEVEITNIYITDNRGLPLNLDNYSYFLSNKKVLVGFSVINGASSISKIRYVLFTKNSLEELEHIDSTGLTRQHEFISDLSYGANLGEIVNIRIDIEDISGNVSSFYYEKLLPDPLMDANTKSGFTIVEAYQKDDGSQLVEVTYDYLGRSSINASNVYAQLSLNGNSWSNISSVALRGDIGAGVMPGRNRIVWKPSLSLSPSTSYPTNVFIKLNLNDADNNNNIGTNSSIVIVNLDAPDIAIRRLSVDEELEEFDSSSSSLSSSSSSN